MLKAKVQEYLRKRKVNKSEKERKKERGGGRAREREKGERPYRTFKNFS